MLSPTYTDTQVPYSVSTWQHWHHSPFQLSYLLSHRMYKFQILSLYSRACFVLFWNVCWTFLGENVQCYEQTYSRTVHIACVCLYSYLCELTNAYMAKALKSIYHQFTIFYKKHHRSPVQHILDQNFVDMLYTFIILNPNRMYLHLQYMGTKLPTS